MVANLNGVIFKQFYGDNSGGAVFDTDGDGTASQEDEFVSIENTTGSPIDLSGWQIWSDAAGVGAPDNPTDGLYHTFPPGTTLDPGREFYIVNEISGTPPPNMQEASASGGANGGNFLSEGRGNDTSEAVALVNPDTGEYIILSFSELGESAFTDMPGFPGTTKVGESNAAADSGEEDQDAGRSYQYNSTSGSYEYSEVAVTCFAAGTLIEVPDGECPVEDLRPGSPVITMDHGIQRIKGVLRRNIDFTAGRNTRHLPVKIEQGALGSNLPSQRLIVSPQHRVLMTAVGNTEYLVPAKALIGRPGISVMQSCRKIVYVHLLFNRHEIVRSHCCWSESFYPGAYATSHLDPMTKIKMDAVFPELMKGRRSESARPFLRVSAAKKLPERVLGAWTSTVEPTKMLFPDDLM